MTDKVLCINANALPHHIFFFVGQGSHCAHSVWRCPNFRICAWRWILHQLGWTTMKTGTSHILTGTKPPLRKPPGTNHHMSSSATFPLTPTRERQHLRQSIHLFTPRLRLPLSACLDLMSPELGVTERLLSLCLSTSAANTYWLGGPLNGL